RRRCLLPFNLFTHLLTRPPDKMKKMIALATMLVVGLLVMVPILTVAQGACGVCEGNLRA
ncbi:MAG: hypothetical protein ACLFVK_04150, partial [Dehalococcoidia bacterium]